MEAKPADARAMSAMSELQPFAALQRGEMTIGKQGFLPQTYPKNFLVTGMPYGTLRQCPSGGRFLDAASPPGAKTGRRRPSWGACGSLCISSQIRQR